MRKRLKRLARRNRNKELEIMRRTAERIVKHAQKYNAVVVVSDISRDKRKIIEANMERSTQVPAPMERLYANKASPRLPNKR